MTPWLKYYQVFWWTCFVAVLINLVAMLSLPTPPEGHAGWLWAVVAMSLGLIITRDGPTGGPPKQSKP